MLLLLNSGFSRALGGGPRQGDRDRLRLPFLLLGDRISVPYHKSSSNNFSKHSQQDQISFIIKIEILISLRLALPFLEVSYLTISTKSVTASANPSSEEDRFEECRVERLRFTESMWIGDGSRESGLGVESSGLRCVIG